MTLEATIAGIGFSSFLLLYAAFQISNQRMIEKAILYFLGLSQVLVIGFVLFSESLESGSAIAYLSGFFEKYFMIMIFAFFAIVAVYMLYLIERAINGFKEGKDGEE